MNQSPGISHPVCIFLIGFMGSGKTHWGKLWADHHNLNFYNLDTIVEANEGMTINSIFHEKGEAHFRASETKALHFFAFQKNFILATGGGTPCFNQNMEWMNEHGITIYLKPSITTLADRLINETQNRPLIKDMDRTELLVYTEKKVIEREVHYLKANLVLPEEKISIDALKGIIT